METIAVVLKQPEQIELNRLALTAPTADDVVVDVDWSGVSTGTERLLWSGRMPPFPGHGLSAGARLRVGRPCRRRGIRDRTASPASACSCPARDVSARCAACSAASASRLVVPAKRVVPIDRHARRTRHPAGAGRDCLSRHRRARRIAAGSASSATACSAGCSRGSRSRSGTIRRSSGRTIRRARGGALGYDVLDPEHDPRRDYRSIYDVSGDAGLLDA